VYAFGADTGAVIWQVLASCSVRVHQHLDGTQRINPRAASAWTLHPQSVPP
jgi:hypothetical protein